jgi:hypothetical protein
MRLRVDDEYGGAPCAETARDYASFGAGFNRRSGMEPFSVKGGAQIGWMKATWPFVTLTLAVAVGLA